jgi:hypothetical protein
VSRDCCLGVVCEAWGVRSYHVTSSLSVLLTAVLLACGDDASPRPQDPGTSHGDASVPSAPNDAGADDAAAPDGGGHDAGLPDGAPPDGGPSLDASLPGVDAGDASASEDGGVQLGEDGGRESDASTPDAETPEPDAGAGEHDAGGSEPDAGDGDRGLRVSSPVEIPLVEGRPDRSTCTEELLGGGAVRYPRTEGTGANQVEVEQIVYCAPNPWEEGERYWELGPHGVSDYAGQPLRHSWGAIVSFYEDGAYQGTLRVYLYEGESQFLDITCMYGTRITGRGLEIDRAEPTTLSCPTPRMSDPASDWRRFGSLELRTVADAPTAVFRPADGSAEVPVTLFSL